MRAELAASLPETAQLQLRTLTPDGAGGFSESWTTVATVGCRVSPSGSQPQERVFADRAGGVSTWTITLPALTAIDLADRLIVGARTFEVVGVIARSQEIGRRVVCAEAT